MSQGIGTQPAYAVFHPIELKKFIFDIMTTHKDHLSCAKHVLACIYVFFFNPIWAFGVHWSGWILCEVELPKVIDMGGAAVQF